MRITLCKIRISSINDYVKNCPSNMKNFKVFWWLYFEGITFGKKEYLHKWWSKTSTILHILGLRFTWVVGVDLDDPDLRLAFSKNQKDQYSNFGNDEEDSE